MSDNNWGFAPPAFKPDEALFRLARELREMGLQERQGQWERRGLPVARLLAHADRIEASRVRRPSRTSAQWQPLTLTNSAQVRDFVNELKKQLAQWSDDD